MAEGDASTINEETKIITCNICEGQFMKKDEHRHKNTLKHYEAAEKKEKQVICKDCKKEYPKGYFKFHATTESHKEAVAERMKNKEKFENDYTTCKICNEIYIRKNVEDHKKTQRHHQAQEDKFPDCIICKEKYEKEHAKDHLKSKLHKIFEQKQKNILKLDRDSKIPRDKYDIQQSSEDSQQYIQTLMTFLLLKYVFNSNPNEFCKFSLNNEEWKQFGDVVIEITAANKKTIVETFCCKKVQSKHNYTFSQLKAETGKFSIKEQIGILEKFNLEASFNLHTISNVSIDDNNYYVFVYNDEIVKDWERSDQEIWKGRKVEITQHTKTNILNTTKDPDDIFTVKVTDLNNVIEYRIFKNQKQVTEMKDDMQKMFEDKFDTGGHIIDKLVKFVHFFFDAEKSIKKGSNFKIIKKKKSTLEIQPKKITGFKMTKEDMILKSAELLLEPFLVLPDNSVEERELELWNELVENFDFIIIRNCEIVKKLYFFINQILKTVTGYTLTDTNKVSVDKSKIGDEFVKSALFENSGFDGSLQFMYITLWKTGFTPLILATENENHLTLILKVINFLKSENLPLKFIILTDLNLDHSLLPEELNGFLNGEDLRLVDYKLFQRILHETRINFLNNFDIRLSEIVECNKDFLSNLTADTLVNMFLGDYFFEDVENVQSEKIMDQTLAVSDDTIQSLSSFVRREGILEMGKNLSYLASVSGEKVYVEIPPDI